MNRKLLLIALLAGLSHQQSLSQCKAGVSTDFDGFQGPSNFL